ncbi:hypothetical protein DKT77_02055 [Meridianimarinicoccus roseus]|jgi:hypothetical protein|uniref:Uncharacterized protein n=1 Tax=Meridianimarinicoccus roseus TaxID=2072018 RepID=A0A2V2LF90_9RHOB|nr:hypothetical protein [Meridianimarinicoccus roseus]PWR04298.1 hypothetical protein DKT77_02055 [Meridianimarinicoccus roseus]
MTRPTLALVLTAFLACLMAAMPVDAGQTGSKPKPKHPPGGAGGGGGKGGGQYQAPLNTQANRQAQALAARARALGQREIAGDYQTSSDRADRLPAFDGQFRNAGGQAGGIAAEAADLVLGNPPAPVRQRMEQDLLSRGISIVPTQAQAQALRAVAQNPAMGINDPNFQTALSYIDDIYLNRGFRNFEIERRAAQSVYDRVDAGQMQDEYEQFSATLDHFGAAGAHGANAYTPAPERGL